MELGLQGHVGRAGLVQVRQHPLHEQGDAAAAVQPLRRRDAAGRKAMQLAQRCCVAVQRIRMLRMARPAGITWTMIEWSHMLGKILEIEFAALQPCCLVLLGAVLVLTRMDRLTHVEQAWC